jgi:hypothetical protein
MKRQCIILNFCKEVVMQNLNWRQGLYGKMRRDFFYNLVRRQVERIRFTYADRNSELERQLPLDANLIERVLLEGSSQEWWLVSFEHPLSHVGTLQPP